MVTRCIWQPPIVGDIALKNVALLALVLAVCLLTDGQRSIFAQANPKLRPLRIALPSHSVTAAPVYIAKNLGIFEKYGFETQILLLEPRAALAALLTGDLDFYTAAGTTGRAALRGVPVRVVMVALNRAEQCIVAAKELRHHMGVIGSCGRPISRTTGPNGPGRERSLKK